MKSKLIPALLAFCLVSGCVTRIAVKPVADDVEGIRYSLPKPLLKVTPQPDGTASFEWISVPDDERTYAIATSSYLAKQKTTIEVDGSGLLKKVSWAPVSSELAAQLASSAADVTKERLKAIEAGRTAAQTKADEAAKAIQTAKDAAATAEEKVATLKAERDELERQGNTDKVKETDVKLAVANAELEAKRRKLETLIPPVKPAGAGNVPEGGAGAGDVAEGASPTQAASATQPPSPKPSRFQQSWGPLFFEVVEQRSPTHTVKLVPVNAQQRFATSTKPQAQTPKASPPIFALKDGAVVVKGASPRPTLTIASSIPLTGVKRDKGILKTRAGKNVTKEFYDTANLKSTTEVEIVLKDETPPDTYTFTIPYATAAGDATTRIEVAFVVVEKKK